MTNSRNWKTLRTTSTTTVDVQFKHLLAPGTKVWLTARWMKCQLGPAANPICIYINFNGMIIPTGVKRAA